MKLFKTVDEKFERIGFTKINENNKIVSYERYDDRFKFTQVLDLVHKNSGRHIVQSYDRDLMDEKKIGNTGVGLTMYEMQLCIKKMKNRGWKNLKISRI